MFIKAIIAAAFAVIQKFLIDKIEYEPLKQYFTAQIGPAKSVAELLTDKNPDNKAQLAQFWNDNRDILVASNLDFAILIIEDKVKDPILRELVVALLKEIKSSQDQPA